MRPLIYGYTGIKNRFLWKFRRLQQPKSLCRTSFRVTFDVTARSVSRPLPRWGTSDAVSRQDSVIGT
jgi:hypothetical protein